MAARLGQVLNWAATAIAVVLFVVALLLGMHGDVGVAVLLAVFAVPIWLIGRASLYVLAGR
jgi:hypothetical protein